MTRPRCPVKESAKKFEIMLCAFVAEHNLPFAAVNHLNNVIKEGITDSNIVKKININRLKVQKIITNDLGPENTKAISVFCSNNYYSLVIDESTDCTVKKNLAIVIRIFDGQCRDQMLFIKCIFYSFSIYYNLLTMLIWKCNLRIAVCIYFCQDYNFLLRQVGRSFLDKSFLDNTLISKINLNENHVENEIIYCGTEVDLYISENNIDNETVKRFKENAMKFCLKFCEDLRNRVNFDDEMYVWLSKFCPENVISGKTNSIVPFLLKAFPNETNHF